MNPPEISYFSRIKLVKWKQSNNASIAEACIHFALMSPESVRKWEQLYFQQGEQVLVQLHKGRSKYGKENSEEKIKPGVGELIVADTKRRLKKLAALRKQPKNSSVKKSSHSRRNTD